MIGKTISHYKILEKLGEGGMGEVYRAEDTKLGREVAIKVLPDKFAQDWERLSRFKREAKVLASLNHPNIAAIYSLEESDGVHFLTLELVEGETLAERVAKGPLPVEETLEVCRQITEGMEAAHEKGIIHRDLKPGNVKITPEGQVKVLDFGLAKALEGETPVADISDSPTLAEEMTRSGVILGTAAYMSPEQARGKPVDKRADIWAFGCVLYELLTGKRPFEAETLTESLAGILKGEPDWETLSANTPWRIRDLLRRCLQKDPHERLRDIGDARIEMKQALSEPSLDTELALSMAPPSYRRQVLPWALLGLMTVAAVIIAALHFGATPEELRTRRFFVSLPEKMSFAPLDLPVISPDGRHIVFSGVAAEGPRLLWVHSLDSLTARPLTGTDGAALAFWSPDSRFIGFFADGKLKKIEHSGGPAQTLCDAPLARGGTWNRQGVILFGTRRDGLYRVSEAGGAATPLTTLDKSRGELSHRWPYFLPDSRHFLYAAEGPQEQQGDVYLGSLESKNVKQLLSDYSNAVYVPPGYLLFVREDTLMAQPFDAKGLQIMGQAFPVAEQVAYSANYGLVHFSASEDGVLAYHQGLGVRQRQLVWVDRQGREEPLAADPRLYNWPRVSPDGARLAISVEDSGNRDVRIYDLARKTLTRLTFDPAFHIDPLWTPDGRRVVFASRREGEAYNLFWKAADGTGQVKRLTTSPYTERPSSFSPDGKSLVFYEAKPETQNDLHVLSMEGEPTPQPLLQTQFNEFRPAISPDGRWVAYQSNESGRAEVYVRPFPNVEEGKWQISTGEGFSPVWAPSGEELFYRTLESMMVVRIEPEPIFSAGRPKVLFTGRYFSTDGRSYDISPDGQRFLMMKEAGQTEEASTRDALVVVENWFEEVKRLVPTGQ